MILLPPLTLPVKQTFATSGLSIRPAISLSRPVTTLSTPGGELLGDPLDQPGGGQRRRGRRLDDRGVAGQQRVRQRRGEDRDGPVERHDHGHHADRLVGHGGLDRDPRRRGQHLGGLDLVGEGQRELPADLEHQGVHPRLVHDLAVLQRQDPGVLVALVGEPLDRGGHLRGPLRGGQRRPGRVGGLRRGDRVGHVLLRRGRGGAHHHAGAGGVHHLQHVAGGPLLASDVEPRGHRGRRAHRARHADRHLSVFPFVGASAVGRAPGPGPLRKFGVYI